MGDLEVSNASMERPGLLSYSDLEEHLRREAPEGLRALPDVQSLSWQSCGKIAHKGFVATTNWALKIGDLPDTPTPGKLRAIYVHVGGKKNNRIGLSIGTSGSEVQFHELRKVVLVEPFRYLNTDMGSENARAKLKALACFLFMAAGHIQTVGKYTTLETDLRKACTWVPKKGKQPSPQTQRAISRTEALKNVIQKKPDLATGVESRPADSLLDTQNRVGKPQSRTDVTAKGPVLATSTGSDLSELSYPTQKPVSSPQVLANSVVVKAQLVASNDSSLSEKDRQDDSTVPKKRPAQLENGSTMAEEHAFSMKRQKIDDLAAKIKRRHKETEMDFETLQQELATLKSDALSYAHLEQKIEEQACQMGRLEKNLEEKEKKVKELKELYYQRHQTTLAELKKAKLAAKDARVDANEARDAARKSDELRTEVETKLKSFREKFVKLGTEFS